MKQCHQAAGFRLWPLLPPLLLLFSSWGLARLSRVEVLNVDIIFITFEVCRVVEDNVGMADTGSFHFS